MTKLVAVRLSVLPSTLLTGLIHYWTLDETSGTRVDCVGGLDLSPVNSASYAAGKIGNAAALELDTSDYLSSSTVEQMSCDWTIAGWFYPESLGAVGTYRTFLRNGGTWGGGGGVDMKIAYNNQFACCLAKGDDSTSACTHAPGIVVGAWNFVAFRNDNAAMTIYARRDLTDALPHLYGFTMLTTTQAVRFGIGQAGGQMFDGLIDEVGWWSRQLSDAELVTLYNGGAGLTYPFT